MMSKVLLCISVLICLEKYIIRVCKLSFLPELDLAEFNMIFFSFGLGIQHRKITAC